MAESETRPFFLRLGTLCRYVDSQVMDLKEELVTHDLKPHNYDRGLKCLKNDVKDLKKLTKDLQPKLASIENFSSYLQSMQELVTQQATDIEKIEKYLLTFGYTPLPKQEKNAKNCEVTVEVAGPPSEQKECGSPDSIEGPPGEDNAKPKGTPVLSNVGLMVVQGKAIPTVRSQACEQHHFLSLSLDFGCLWLVGGLAVSFDADCSLGNETEVQYYRACDNQSRIYCVDLLQQSERPFYRSDSTLKIQN
nr:uncharacterized protein LOC113801339 [Penaeus vannamei]